MKRFSDAESLVDAILARVGSTVVLGLPLGLGKSADVADALYRRAQEDRALDLTILTALTLERPSVGSGLRARFAGPLLDRAFAGYHPPLYAAAQAKGELPPNVRVSEFFFAPGGRLGSPSAQQSYTSVNYSHAARMVRNAGTNVVAQLVAESDTGISLSCNPDVTLDLLGEGGPMLVGQPHPALPHMGGDACLPKERFDALLDLAPAPLPSLPDQPLDTAAHFIGLHASTLVKDGGTLQIGIGDLAEAVASALILRHRQNATYRALMGRAAHVDIGGLAPFEEGLYGCSEMLVEGFMHLIDAGILKRAASDGAWLHGGFFLGPRRLLERLKTMSPERAERVRMKPISFINDSHHDFEAKAADRKHARFLNGAMMVTLGGAVVSDGLEDGRVVSGVGGQHDFVTMAHALPDARSVLMLRSTRKSKHGLQSNIRYAYGHVTIPRHLRDLVVTEYGTADLRDRNDREVIEAMLGITDARFVEALAEEAKRNGKLPADFRITDRMRANRPKALEATRDAHAEFLPAFPLATDWSPVEQELLSALQHLAEREMPDPTDLAALFQVPASAQAHLERMDLADPSGVRELALQRLLLYALRATDAI